MSLCVEMCVCVREQVHGGDVGCFVRLSVATQEDMQTDGRQTRAGNDER